MNQQTAFLEYVSSSLSEFKSLSRFGDGEVQIMRGRRIRGIDGWVSNGGESLIRTQLLAVAALDSLNLLKAVPCKCHYAEDNNYAIETLNSCNQLIPSNIFVNCCANSASAWLRNNAEQAFIFTNVRHSPKDRLAQISSVNKTPVENIHALFENDCFDWWDINFESIWGFCSSMACNNENMKFLFSAGPIATVLCGLLAFHFPRNIYIDCGSILDSALLGDVNRPYQIEAHPDSLLNCYI